MILSKSQVSNTLNQYLVNNPQSISGITISKKTLWSSAAALVGTAIEEIVAETLNSVSTDDCFFENATDCKFPDIYQRDSNSNGIISGIEVKSWWLDSAESKPCFRFSTSKNACGEHDLIVLVSWSFNQNSNPEVKSVFVENCHDLIELRNGQWCKDHPGDEIISPECTVYGGSGRDQITDRPKNGDKGKNFGRLARSKIGVLNEWIEDQLLKNRMGKV